MELKDFLRGVWDFVSRLILVPAVMTVVIAIAVGGVLLVVLRPIGWMVGIPVGAAEEGISLLDGLIACVTSAAGLISGGYTIVKGVKVLKGEYPAFDRFLGASNERFDVSEVSLRHDDPDLTGSLPDFRAYLNEKQILPRVGDEVLIPYEIACASSVHVDGETETRMVKVQTTGIAEVSGVLFIPPGKRFSSQSALKKGKVIVHVQTEECKIVEKCG